MIWEYCSKHYGLVQLVLDALVGLQYIYAIAEVTVSTTNYAYRTQLLASTPLESSLLPDMNMA